MIEDTLVLDYCADLLSESEFEPLIDEVLSAPLGHWNDVHSLCARLGLRAPPAVENGVDLMVAWLTAPAIGPGTVILVFASESELWSTISLYSRLRALRATY
jgi:hypothetical protein